MIRLSDDPVRMKSEIEKILTELQDAIKEKNIGGSKNEIISIVDNQDKTFKVRFKTSQGYIESTASYKVTGD